MAERVVQELELAGGRPSSSSLTPAREASSTAAGAGGGGGGTGGTGGSGTGTGKPDEEDVREATFYRLESLGYRVGQGLAER